MKLSHILALSTVLIISLLALGQLEGWKTYELVLDRFGGPVSPKPLFLLEPYQPLIPAQPVETMAENGKAQEGRPQSLEGLEAEVRGKATERSGAATYYHPDLAGGLMADNHTRYDPTASGVVAAVSWPLGTILEVRGPTNRVLLVVVSDTGYLGEWHTDWSEADFTLLALSLDPGRIEVRIREVQEP